LKILFLPLLSQWPIPPAHYFDYELHFESDQAGTYFYHSHVGFQGVSCSGPLIIEERTRPPYDYDGERTVYLSDFFNETDTEISEGLAANPFVWSGETNAVLINGIGVSNTLAQSDTSSCPLATIAVQPGKKYRFRFIGATALSFVSLAFEGHNLSVIEADGGYTKPVNTSFMQVGPGQRYSALLITKTCDELQGQRRFWIQTETRERPTLYRGYALLVYSDECDIQVPTTPPLTLPNTTLGWLDYELRPLAPNDFPSLDEVTRRVTLSMQMIVNGTIIWTENGLPWLWTFPSKPYLASLYQHDESGIPNYINAVANGGMDNRARAFPAKVGEVLEIVIQNTGATSGGLDVHSFHAHGAHVYDIGAGNGTYDAYANEERLQGTHPVKRDTTMLYSYETKTDPGADGGWRAWRLRITEPGVWMIHCHTLQVSEQ
jgi:L-ascorbate oxidase